MTIRLRQIVGFRAPRQGRLPDIVASSGRDNYDCFWSNDNWKME
jgi:hypothetical protein